MYSNLKEEKNLWKKGYKFVVGLDEAGRGPLAGPVVAAAVSINPKHEIRLIPQNYSYAISGSNPKQYQNPKFKCLKRVLNLEFEKFEFVSNFDIRISKLGIRDSKQLTP